MKHPVFSFKWTYMLPLVVFTFLAAACGSSSPVQTPPASTAGQAVPTMPAARFTAVAQQVYTETSVSVSSTQASSTPDSGASMARGATIYGNRCASCHGEQGEGIADKGEALAGKLTTLTAFDDLLRTGGQGSLGPDHLFGPTAISPSGLEALYTYVQSFSE